MSERARPERLRGERTTTGTLGVRVLDDYTGGLPRGEVAVRIAGAEARPFRNPSGFYVFTDATVGPQVTVVVEGNDRYRPFEGDRVPPADGPPIVTVRLAPSTAYPFSGGTTLARGTVRLTDRTPVADAAVTIRDAAPATTTEADGGFVLPLDDLPIVTRRVPVDGGPATVPRQVLEVDGADPVLVVTRGGTERTRQAEVRTGGRWSVHVELPP